MLCSILQHKIYELLIYYRENCTYDGAWVEPKGLLVAWHYREVSRDRREDLLEKASSIYKKLDPDF